MLNIANTPGEYSFVISFSLVATQLPLTAYYNLSSLMQLYVCPHLVSGVEFSNSHLKLGVVPVYKSTRVIALKTFKRKPHIDLCLLSTDVHMNYTKHHNCWCVFLKNAHHINHQICVSLWGVKLMSNGKNRRLRLTATVLCLAVGSLWSSTDTMLLCCNNLQHVLSEGKFHFSTLQAVKPAWQWAT